MPEIESAVPLVPLSPTVATDSVQVQHHDPEVSLNGLLPELHDQRLALEQEVAYLKEKLMHEIKVREALKGGLQRSVGTLPKIPGYVSAKTRELLFEVAVLEEEVIFLEKHAVYLRQELQDELKPGLSPSFRLGGEQVTASVFRKPTTLVIDIPESGVSEPSSTVQTSEPTTPITVTPLLTPFVTPEWRPSASSSPSFMDDGNMAPPVLVPSAFALPLPMASSPLHGDESGSVPPQVLNRKRVFRRGSSSSESLPADLCEVYNVVGKPSKKKPNHKKSQSLPSDVRKAGIEYDDSNFVKPSSVRKEVGRGDVFQRLSAPKNGGHARASVLPSPPVKSDKPGNTAVRRSASVKEAQSKYLSQRSPPPANLLNEKANDYTKRTTKKKELHGRSPPLASPQLETKVIPYFRRSSSNREMQPECSPASTPSPVFEDKAIATIKRIVSSMSPTGSPQLKYHNLTGSPFTPMAEQGNQDRLVTPFKLPPTGEKENVKVLTLSDERRRTHDLVITKSLPPIKLNNKISTPFNGAVQHRLVGVNNFSENAKLYAKSKLFPTPTNQGYKVKPVQVQKPLPKSGDSEQSAPKTRKYFPHSHRPESDDVDSDFKDDKVDMACGPISDASWLSEDLAKLFGTVCSKIRRHSSSPDTKTVAKPPASLLGSSQRVESFGRSQSFDIRSQEALQLLQEYCSDDMNLTESYDVRKQRAANTGPHRHYYKAIKLPLEQKMKA